MDDKKLYELAMAGYNYDKMLDFIPWVIDLDIPDNADRRTVTLNQIVEKAKATKVTDNG